MIREYRNNSVPETSPPLGATSWCVAALLTLALIGLLHDRNFAAARGAESVEAGRGLESSVDSTGVAAAATGRVIGFVLLLGAGAVCAVTLPGQPRLHWDTLALLIGLSLMWAFASWFWSEHRATTARELVRLSIFVGVAAALASRFDLRRICIVLGIALAGSVLTSIGFEVITGGFRPWQADYRLAGTLHSNAVAIESSVVAIIAYAFALRGNDRKLLWYSIFLAAAAVIVLTKTRTALGTVAVGIVAIHLAGRPTRDWLLAAASAASLLAVGLLTATVLDVPLADNSQKLVSLGRDDGGDATLTGRVPLWQFILNETADRRIQGVGYGTFWRRQRTEIASDTLHWFPRQSHNAYVEVVATVGVVGLAVILSAGVVALAQATALAARFGRPEYCALVALLAAAFVSGLTETGFVIPRDVGLVTAAIVFSLVLQPARKPEPAMLNNGRNGAFRSPIQFGPGLRFDLRNPPGRGRQWSKP